MMSASRSAFCRYDPRVAAVLVLVAMVGAAIVFLGLAAGAARDEVVLRQRGQVAPATVLEINRSERRKNLPARVVLAYVGPDPAGRVEVRGVPDDVDVGAAVPVLHDPQDPSRARIATLGWPVMDVLVLLLGVVVSALLPVAMLRVWLRGRRRLSAPRERREQPAQQEAKHPRGSAAEVSPEE
jgi:Protein of unknown function (DUF3592)